MAELQKLYDAILRGDHKTATAITQEALAEKVPPVELVSKYMVPAMDEVGRRFECKEYYVPDMLLSARAMKGALEVLRPCLAASGTEPAGCVVIGTVQGDLHDIGKNIVASMLEGGGFEVVDLGTDVSPAKFVDAVKTRKTDIVALSALLTTTMPVMQKTIDALKEAGLRQTVKVIVGGAPLSREYAEKAGADGFSENAASAVTLVRQLTGVTAS
jgi:5-methyltetrahydrofolate--homocysteine methyltransferase